MSVHERLRMVAESTKSANHLRGQVAIAFVCFTDEIVSLLNGWSDGYIITPSNWKTIAFSTASKIAGSLRQAGSRGAIHILVRGEVVCTWRLSISRNDIYYAQEIFAKNHTFSENYTYGVHSSTSSRRDEDAKRRAVEISSEEAYELKRKMKLADEDAKKRAEKRSSQAVKKELVVKNVNAIYTLSDVESGDILRFYLRNFPGDPLPSLSKDIGIICGDSGIGKALLNWKGEKIIENKSSTDGPKFCYIIIGVERYAAPVHSEIRTSESTTLVESGVFSYESTDPAKHANGHLAREANRWGSLPMHDAYGDESSGEERDYEDWPEYEANYAE